MAKKIINLVFLGVIVVTLLMGVVTALFFPQEKAMFENRYANQLPSLTLENYLDGSFQEGMDVGLSDQVNFSPYYRKLYNLIRLCTLSRVVLPFAECHPDRYVSFLGLQIFGGNYLTYSPSELPSIKEALDAKIEHYNERLAWQSDAEFYIYYIEGDRDINFETGEKTGTFEYLRDGLELPRERIARLNIDSFENYTWWFYRTDHHWNHQGAYEAYLEVLNLLEVEDEPLTPEKEVALPGQMVGSKLTPVGGGFLGGIWNGIWESAYMYRFPFPEVNVEINGEPAEDYGSYSLFLSGEGGRPGYSGLYGSDEGEIVLSGGRPDGENILLIGNSYDNALLKLLASHFNALYAVDLRFYEAHMGEEFQLDTYLEKNDIQKVLLIGDESYFTSGTFRLEG